MNGIFLRKFTIVIRIDDENGHVFNYSIVLRGKAKKKNTFVCFANKIEKWPDDDKSGDKISRNFQI